jgi:YVTN family beta-propeller protein
MIVPRPHNEGSRRLRRRGQHIRPGRLARRVRSLAVLLTLASHLVMQGHPAHAELFAYVLAPEGAAAVDVVNLRTHAVKIIVVGTFAWAASVSPNDALFLVRSADESNPGVPPAYRLAVIDTARRFVRSTVPVHSAGGVAVGPKAQLAYVTDCDPDGVVSVIDLGTGAPLAEIPLDVNPQNIWMTPNGALAYVTDGGYCATSGSTDNNIAVVDTATQRERGKISLDGVPLSIAFAPSSDVLYVIKTSFSGPGSVTVISTTTDQPVAHLPLDNPTALAVAPDGRRLYVVNSPGGTGGVVSVIDTASMESIGTITLPGADSPFGLAVHPNGRTVYLTHRNATGEYLAAVDAGTYAVVDDIPVPYAGSIGIVSTCPGDCDGDGQITGNEIIRTVGIALGQAPLQSCPTADATGDGAIAIDELVRELTGCTPPVSPSAPPPPLPEGASCQTGRLRREASVHLAAPAHECHI